MQGERSILDLDSFPETFGLDHSSGSSNTGANPQQYWHDVLNPVESGYQELPPTLGLETNSTHINAVIHDGRSLNGWNLGEPSSSERTRDQMIQEEAKTGHGRVTSQSGFGLRLEERRHINLNSDQVGNGSLFAESSSSGEVFRNFNLNAEYTSNSSSNIQFIEAGIPHMYMPIGSQTEHIRPASSSGDPFVTASRNAEYLSDERDGRPGCSLDGRRSSCKRKMLEGVSGNSSFDGSSSCFTRPGSSPWNLFSGQCDAGSSSSMSIPTDNTPSTNLPIQLNPQSGVGMRGVTSDSHPALTLGGQAAESSQRNLRLRANPANHHDLPPSDLTSAAYPGRLSHVWPPRDLSSRNIPSNQSLDLRPAVASSQSRSSVMHNHGLAPNIFPFPHNRNPNSMVGSSSNLTVHGERANTLREEVRSRRTPRSISGHPMFLPASEMRNLTPDPANWTSANGSSSTPGNLASNSRVGSSSTIHPSPAPTWLSHPNPTSQYTRRLSEVVSRSFYPYAGSESGGQSSNFQPSPSVPSSSHVVVSSSTGQPVNSLPHPRSAFWMDRQGAGVPVSLRSLAAGSEGRGRLLSEIRNVLDMVRRGGGDGLRLEDVLILDQSVFFGVADLHDRHRDMRLDVDNMSYEELLALEERIGNVSTGLSEEIILKSLKQRKYYTIRVNPPAETEPCCICQEEYVEGEHLGTLDCGHDFHSECVKQWLKQKNLCPICKTTGLVT